MAESTSGRLTVRNGPENPVCPSCSQLPISSGSPGKRPSKRKWTPTSSPNKVRKVSPQKNTLLTFFSVIPKPDSASQERSNLSRDTEEEDCVIMDVKKPSPVVVDLVDNTEYFSDDGETDKLLSEVSYEDRLLRTPDQDYFSDDGEIDRILSDITYDEDRPREWEVLDDQDYFSHDELYSALNLDSPNTVYID